MAKDGVHYRACNLCEAICGVEIHVAGGRVEKIRGDALDPLSRGYLCPKATALQDVHEDPDRLRHPVRRTARGFERIGWDEALDEVASRIVAIQKEHGREAAALYMGNPTVHNHGSMLFGIPFAKALGTRNKFSATSVDQLPHHLAAYAMFGHQLFLPIPDLDRTSYLLVIGGNPVVSNGSLMTAPDVKKRLEALRARGGKLVVLDPRRTETAAVADRHLFVKPGADALVLLGVLHVLFAEGLAAPGRVAGFTDGLDLVREAARAFPPERVAPASGVEADAIRAIARELAAASSGAVYGRMGASTQEFGGLVQWLCNVVNVVTGNLDRAGGVMFTRPALDLVGVTGRTGSRGGFARGKTRVRGLPEAGGEYPVAALAEEITTPGRGQIRALVTSAGNPVLSTPNGRNLDRALASLDFMVSVDFYVNETTRHAHVILPPTAALEHDHYDVIFHALAIRNTARWSPPVFEPAAGAKHDWEIFRDLAARISKKRGKNRLRDRAERLLFATLTPRRLVDLGLRLGPHRLSVAKLERSPHGVDLGPLEPCLPGRLFAKDRRIALAPEIYLRDLPRLEARWLGPEGEAGEEGAFDLRLIGRRHLRSNNSWMHNSRRLVKGKERCTLLVHPDDASRRGLSAGSRALVSSRAGTVELPVEITDEMMPGVVSIPHGFGHDRPGVELQVARERPGVSANDLTDELFLDALSGNAALSGVPVRVEVVP